MSTETTATTTAPATPPGRREREDLLQSLRAHRGLLRATVRDLGDEQAGARTTVSALCLGGLVKHVTSTEAHWARFIEIGADAIAGADPDERDAQLHMAPSEKLTDVLARYDAVAAATDALVTSIADLDAEQLLPEAPWFPHGTAWSARRVLLHVVAETAQHAGHADILRESLDGATTRA